MNATFSLTIISAGVGHTKHCLRYIDCCCDDIFCMWYYSEIFNEIEPKHWQLLRNDRQWKTTHALLVKLVRLAIETGAVTGML